MIFQTIKMMHFIGFVVDWLKWCISQVLKLTDYKWRIVVLRRFWMSVTMEVFKIDCHVNGNSSNASLKEKFLFKWVGISEVYWGGNSSESDFSYIFFNLDYMLSQLSKCSGNTEVMTMYKDSQADCNWDRCCTLSHSLCSMNEK